MTSVQIRTEVTFNRRLKRIWVGGPNVPSLQTIYIERNKIQDSCKDRANLDVPHYCMPSLHFSTDLILLLISLCLFIYNPIPQKMENLRFYILTEMPTNIPPLRNVTPFTLGNVYRHFERTCCIHFQDIKQHHEYRDCTCFHKAGKHLRDYAVRVAVQTGINFMINWVVCFGGKLIAEVKSERGASREIAINFDLNSTWC